MVFPSTQALPTTVLCHREMADADEWMTGRMIAPSAQMMLLARAHVQKTTFLDDR
jgi:hypothetical protein